MSLPTLQLRSGKVSLVSKAPIWILTSSLLLNLLLTMLMSCVLSREASLRQRQVSSAYVQERGAARLLIIARTHAREMPTVVSAFLSSLRAQSYESFQVWLVNGECPGKAIYSDIVDDMSDNRFSTRRFGEGMEPLEYSSFGYYTSDLAVNELLRLNDAGLSNYEYLLITNADNLYHHLFLDTVVKKFAAHPSPPCIVATDWISRYLTRAKSGKFGSRNTVRHAEFRRFRIDLGTAVVRVASLRRAFSGMSEVFVKNSSVADWMYFERILGPSKHCGVVIAEVLFIHQ
jgi:hypothetical protein